MSRIRSLGRVRRMLFASAVLACACDSRKPATVAPPAAVPATFVGSAACGGCHAEEAERWRRSHHARAMQPADGSTVLGDFSAPPVSHGGVVSSFAMREGVYVLRTDGPEGELHDYPIAYTFGVDPLQQYLVAFPGGRLQATSLAWDARPRTEGGQRWIDLHGEAKIGPGDPLHWTGAAGAWNFQCAECHSTDVRKGWQAADARYDTRWAEVSVGCEACHGPGSAHVAWANGGPATRSSDAGEAADGLVVRFRERTPATWSFDGDAPIAKRSAPRTSHAELDACGRCHARRSVIADPYEYGRPLLDGHLPALLDQDLYYDDGQIREEVYEWGSFLQSRMYAAGVTCGDCHDPHDGALRRGGGNATCSGCHRPEHFDTPSHHHHASGSPGARCVSCHMPPRTYMQVDARHDHSLRLPRPDLTETLGTPDACQPCHTERTAKWAAQTVARWRGPGPGPRPHFGEALAAARRGQVRGTEKLLALAGDASQPAIARATALVELERSPGDASFGALRRAAGENDPLLRLAAAQASRSLSSEARLAAAGPLLRDPIRAVRIEAARALASLPPGLFAAGQRAELARGLGEWRAAQEANADRPEAWVNLGTLEAERGDGAAARDRYQRALALAPYFVPAYLNLADLERAEGRDDEAARLLERARALAPQSAEVHYALGLLRVRQKRLPDAVAELEEAANLAPESDRFTQVYAMALGESGAPERAFAVLEAAHRRRPGEPEILATLASLAAERGDVARTRSALEALRAIAPDHPMLRDDRSAETDGK
ncbi:MAG TPA: tetratricopeptide repeat protein [Myxococcota bacterium]|nr:tetratricopeptide repeat protein [Myxococcota bacterium]